MKFCGVHKRRPRNAYSCGGRYAVETRMIQSLLTSLGRPLLIACTVCLLSIWMSITSSKGGVDNAAVLKERSIAVVIPFHDGDVAMVESNLNRWSTFVPCSERAYSSMKHIVFYYAGNKTSTDDTVKRVLDKWRTLPGHVRTCFDDRDPLVSYAALSEEENTFSFVTLPDGTRVVEDTTAANHLFFKLWMNAPVIGTATANVEVEDLMWMEPDCRPNKSGWLDVLAEEAYHASRLGYFMRGSLHRGPLSKSTVSSWSEGQLTMINGNAMYNFQNPVMKSIIAAVQSKYGYKGTFDGNIHAFLHEKEQWQRKQSLSHAFQYTSSIVHIGSKWQYNAMTFEEAAQYGKEAYLLHGPFVT